MYVGGQPFLDHDLYMCYIGLSLPPKASLISSNSSQQPHAIWPVYKLPWLRRAKMADVSDEQQQAVDNSNGSKPKLMNCRGTHAQFLRENPRFLNDPICHVVPSETSRDVEECLSWGVATTRAKPPTRSVTMQPVCSSCMPV